MFALGMIIVYTVVALLFMGSLGTVSGFESGGNPSGFSIFAGLLMAIIVLASIVPSIAVQVRRFHDQDKSGWFVLLGFIPYVGGLIVLVFMCLEGTSGPNKFGTDPKQE